MTLILNVLFVFEIRKAFLVKRDFILIYPMSSIFIMIEFMCSLLFTINSQRRRKNQFYNYEILN